MKTTAKTLAVLLLVALFGSSCETVSRLNAEYEEEMVRIEKMSPEERAEWERAQHEKEQIELFEFSRAGESD